jgi:hypothetical protein
MDEVEVRPAEQLFDGVAERAFPGGVEVLEVAVGAGDAQQVGRDGEEVVQPLGGPSSLGLGPVARGEIPIAADEQPGSRSVVDLRFRD